MTCDTNKKIFINREPQLKHKDRRNSSWRYKILFKTNSLSKEILTKALKSFLFALEVYNK
jgi:hypothetical protein